MGGIATAPRMMVAGACMAKPMTMAIRTITVVMLTATVTETSTKRDRIMAARVTITARKEKAARRGLGPQIRHTGLPHRSVAMARLAH